LSTTLSVAVFDSDGGCFADSQSNPDFSTSNGPDVHVILARSDDENLTHEIVKGQLDSVELGSLKGNQGDQNYDLPASVDLHKYNAAVIYCERLHAVFGVARLEQF
jgi:Electron transfer DM13